MAYQCKNVVHVVKHNTNVQFYKDLRKKKKVMGGNSKSILKEMGLTNQKGSLFILDKRERRGTLVFLRHVVQI